MSAAAARLAVTTAVSGKKNKCHYGGGGIKYRRCSCDRSGRRTEQPDNTGKYGSSFFRKSRARRVDLMHGGTTETSAETVGFIQPLSLKIARGKIKHVKYVIIVYTVE